MNVFAIVVVLMGLFVVYCSAFISTVSLAGKNSVTENKRLFMGLRRNNKEEKQKRNRAYARKFQLANGGSRKQLVVEMKRQIVASAEENFTAKLFQYTTDADMPEYRGFDD